MSRLDTQISTVQSVNSFQSPKIYSNMNSPQNELTPGSLKPGIFPSPKSTASLESATEDKDIEDVYRVPNLDFFKEAHIGDLAKYVSSVLSDIVAVNDQSPLTAAKLTRFHSRQPPSISIRDYILRIVKFCNLEKAVLLVLLYLVDLFTDSYSRFVLSSLTVHRFIITAIAVASKGLCDIFCTNRHYAKVGGVSVIELNLLEVEFLTRVNYRIVPPMDCLPKYYHLIKEKCEVQPSEQSAPSSITRKHSRDDSMRFSNSAAPSQSTASTSGSKGFKAVKETFKFLHNKKKKKNDSNPADV